MPKDKTIKAKAAASNDNQPKISDIGKASHKQSLAENKEPVAMPPFTSGII